MKNLLKIALLISLAPSLFASADVFEKETQTCIYDQILEQHQKFFSNSNFHSFVVEAHNEDNWEAILFTLYGDDINLNRSFVTLEKGDYKNTTLSIGGVILRKLDISFCF